MIEPDDGGPAFPMDWMDFQPHTGEQVVRQQFPGMTLRDYFAAKAMQGIITSLGEESHRKQMLREGHTLRDIPAVAYEIADAMLAERAKQP